MDKPFGWAALLFAMFLAYSCAERITDQNTIRDCSIKGEARMAGGGIIICEVKKDDSGNI